MGLVAIGSSSGSDPIVSPSLTILVLSQSMSWGLVGYEHGKVWILNSVHYQVPIQLNLQERK